MSINTISHPVGSEPRINLLSEFDNGKLLNSPSLWMAKLDQELSENQLKPEILQVKLDQLIQLTNSLNKISFTDWVWTAMLPKRNFDVELYKKARDNNFLESLLVSLIIHNRSNFSLSTQISNENLNKILLKYGSESINPLRNIRHDVGTKPSWLGNNTYAIRRIYENSDEFLSLALGLEVYSSKLLTNLNLSADTPEAIYFTFTVNNEVKTAALKIVCLPAWKRYVTLAGELISASLINCDYVICGFPIEDIKNSSELGLLDFLDKNLELEIKNTELILVAIDDTSPMAQYGMSLPICSRIAHKPSKIGPIKLLYSDRYNFLIDNSLPLEIFKASAQQDH
jgi:hypothetical protein